MTGPLAEQIAQVREGIGAVDADSGLMEGLIGREAKRVEDALAALSAIERHVQDMETAILRHVTQGDVTPYWSSAHLCNGKCPDLDMPDVRDPECLACLAMDFSRAALPASGTRNRVAREKGTE